MDGNIPLLVSGSLTSYIKKNKINNFPLYTYAAKVQHRERRLVGLVWLALLYINEGVTY